MKPDIFARFSHSASRRGNLVAAGAARSAVTDSPKSDRGGRFARGWPRAASAATTILLLCAFLSRFPLLGGAQESALRWQSYRPEALEEAKATSKPVFMDFTATWCVPCHQMEQKVFPDPRLAPLLQQFVLLRVNMTDQDSPVVKTLAKEFDAETLPTIVIFDAQGKRAFHESGFLGVDKLLPVLQGVLKVSLPQSSPAAASRVEKHAHFSVTVSPPEARRGETVTVSVAAAIDEGWHLFALPWTNKKPAPMPTTITFTDLGGLKQQGKLQQSQPKSDYDPNFKINIQLFERNAIFTQKLFIPQDHPLGTTEIALMVKVQTCDPSQCVSFSEKLTAKVAVAEGAVRKEFVSKEPVMEGVTARDGFNEVAGTGLWGFLTLALGAGFLSLLTPCVFPMIPITVSFFIKQDGEARGRSVKLAVAYCGGIVGMFTVLGLALSAALGAEGPNALAANPVVNLLMATLFVAFALSLFGLFEIQAPTAITNFLNRKSAATSGYVGAILMGLTFTLAAFTCTVPFAGAVLAAAATGQWFRPTLGMLAYSCAFASPFFLLALFPRWLASLPKSGGWLNSVKVTMGFLELAAALKFISNTDLIWGWDIFTPTAVLAGWTAITAFTGIYLLGRFHLPHDTKVEHIGAVRMLISLVTIALSLYLASGLLGRQLHPFIESYLPLKSADKLTWLSILEEAKAEARAQNKPIFIDFTGYTCTNCRFNELNVFMRPEIEELLKKYIRLRLYTDGGANAEAHQKYQIEKFKTSALPHYVIMDADEKVFGERGGTIANTGAFRAFLEAGLESAGIKATALWLDAPFPPCENAPLWEIRNGFTKRWRGVLGQSLRASFARCSTQANSAPAQWCAPRIKSIGLLPLILTFFGRSLARHRGRDAFL